MSSFNIATARERFPALKQSQVFFDNAGGSQVLGDVADSIYSYLTGGQVQLGASYNIGKKSSSAYSAGYEAAARYINSSRDEIVLGASTTQLFRNLSLALTFPPGSEIILSQLEHETNVSSWFALAQRQRLTVKWWTPFSSRNPKLEVSLLSTLLSPKTVFVACTHVSNILGSIHEIRAIAAKVHEIPGALLCVDGVSFAPHRAIDVKHLGVDFYAFSWYKVYGPHIALLYASGEVLDRVGSLGHFFNPSATLDNKLGLAGASYELVQSLPAIVEYFGPEPEMAWEAVSRHEEKLAALLLAFLNEEGKVTVYGEESEESRLRVPTVSFTVEGRGSRELVEAVEERSKGSMGIRWGHFYSKRLVEQLLALDGEGVVRVSLVHYNTEEEVHKLVSLLKEVIG